MLQTPIEPRLAWSDYVVVRLLRRWAAVRASEGRALPNLVGLAKEIGEPVQAAIALHSLFQLTEACLGRPLEPECCCSPELSSDESAVLKLIAAAPASSPAGISREIPHGLPGALCWAAKAVAIALGIETRPAGSAATRCPFRHCAM